MQKSLVLGCLILWLILAPFLLKAQAAAPPRLAAVVDLGKLLQGKPEVSVEAGEGVSFRVVAAPEGGFRQDLTVYDGGRKVKDLEGGRFTEFARLEAPAASYWIIGEFTGGAHCCGQFHFFSRPGAGHPLKYLGKTEGYNGGPMPLTGSFIFRDGEIFCRSFLDRFDYFHASHAESMLVNVPPVFYHLSPGAVVMDNQPFTDFYRGEAARVQRELSQELPGRPKPESIFQPGWAAGYNNLAFSDHLGQLLVKRTIFYLYAREDRLAWETLARDLGKYYQTSQWLDNLEHEIIEIVSQSGG
jgi:hypothetical protein